MTKLIPTIMLVCVSWCSSGQAFAFSASVRQDYTVGKDLDFTKNALKSPLSVTFEDGRLTTTFSDGKEFMPVVTVSRVIPFKKLKENEAAAYFLEYKDESGLTAYITYKKVRNSSGKMVESITFPLILERHYYAFKYLEFSSL